MSKKIKTRFAPSPTGYLHIGGARTALFSWLYARKMGGDFVLRIEDTDQERSTQASVDAILDGMTWLGLDYDEGPYYQMQRMDRYKEIISQLMEQGDAYYCYCTPEELEEMRNEQRARKEKPRYDGRWRDSTTTPPTGVEPVVRFKNPLDGVVTFQDEVRGEITVSNAELDDLIIARSDGTPTYNLTVVVDDMDMEITHVIRGDDHINNTPRQVNILKALNAPLPVYAHVPMILGDDGKRLSKRHGALSVMEYRDMGYLPQATLNYLVRLGWSHGDEELFTLEQMKSLFDLSGVNRSPSAFNTEKLQWINQQYIMSEAPTEVAKHLQWHLDNKGVDISSGPAIEKVIDALKERVKTLDELAEATRNFYIDIPVYDEKAKNKQLSEASKPVLEELHTLMSGIDPWNGQAAHDVIGALVEKLEVGFGKVGAPCRVALTGVMGGPSLEVIFELLGKECTLKRLQAAIDAIN